MGNSLPKPPAATFTPTTPTLAMMKIAALALCLLLGSAVAQEEPEEMMSLMDAEGMMMMEDAETGMMMTEDGTMMMDPAMMEIMDGMTYDPESEMYIDEDGMVMPMTEDMMMMIGQQISDDFFDGDGFPIRPGNDVSISGDGGVLTINFNNPPSP